MELEDRQEKESVSSSQRQAFSMMGEIYHDQIVLENELKNMSKEDKYQLKKFLSTKKSKDILIQTMDGSLEELERVYGKENVKNFSKRIKHKGGKNV
ncbi:hypothetical protein [Enterococcus rivorum]|uniref:Uncharacterized protein n=1 Tax=Enterococcus rivorum TaxID=762845 RepID=A0A1E5L0F8_9ENTE|nr:hypothetical protein [Enterococcus rivorum]MBP2098874.1 hypothetical protein [Enterococcus rivorum]OEH83601.1 hypothetical protein BCR26_08980 [Enterococcus rivorum]